MNRSGPIAKPTLAGSVRQAERNLYLPQPNYLVLSGGKPIDVGKIEVVEYREGSHRLYWKTIASENGSATFDDGIISFDRSSRGTAVTIFGRQLFVLPPLWQAIDLVLDPEVRGKLVTDAYSTFFDRTLSNLEALAEGRDIRIGRNWMTTEEGRAPGAPSIGGPGTDGGAVPRLARFCIPKLATALEPGDGNVAKRIDADGFTHVRPDLDPTRDHALAAAAFVEIVDRRRRILVGDDRGRSPRMRANLEPARK